MLVSGYQMPRQLWRNIESDFTKISFPDWSVFHLKLWKQKVKLDLCHNLYPLYYKTSQAVYKRSRQNHFSMGAGAFPNPTPTAVTWNVSSVFCTNRADLSCPQCRVPSGAPFLLTLYSLLFSKLLISELSDLKTIQKILNYYWLWLFSQTFSICSKNTIY